MCGTLKYEMTAKKIGNPISATPNQIVSVQKGDGSMVMSRWLGHIREESGTPVLAHEPVKIYATQYTEKNVPFLVPLDKAIDAYLIFSDNYPGGKGVFIITRKATNKELLRCKHPRHPRFIDK